VGACRFSTAARRPTFPGADAATIENATDIAINDHRTDSAMTTKLKNRRILEYRH